MAAGREIAVLVHGLWMHGIVMQWQGRCLRQTGFDAIAYSYPSTRLSVTENADLLALFAHKLDASTLHWVGHSLGGLVILRMLERDPALPPGRIVLLGPPYGGTHAGTSLARSRLGKRMLGRGISELAELQKQARFPGREIGVIAGNYPLGLGRVVAWDLPLPNDGAVTVAETQVAAACDRIELPVTHTGMLFSRRVAQQTAAFLRAGRFDHGAGAR